VYKLEHLQVPVEDTQAPNDPQLMDVVEHLSTGGATAHVAPLYLSKHMQYAAMPAYKTEAAGAVDTAVIADEVLPATADKDAGAR
jgi:hypothetical protein